MDDMKLDFSKLANIGRKEQEKGGKGYNNTNKDEKTKKTANTGEKQIADALRGLQNVARGYQAKNQAKATAKKGQDYIRKSEMLRAKMAKDTAAGADDLNLLLDALYCVYLMTGDKTLFNQIIAGLKETHAPEKIDEIINKIKA